MSPTISLSPTIRLRATRLLSRCLRIAVHAAYARCLNAGGRCWHGKPPSPSIRGIVRDVPRKLCRQRSDHYRAQAAGAGRNRSLQLSTLRWGPRARVPFNPLNQFRNLRRRWRSRRPKKVSTGWRNPKRGEAISRGAISRKAIGNRGFPSYRGSKSASGSVARLAVDTEERHLIATATGTISSRR